MRIVGLTGGSGSGKSTLAARLLDLGVPVFDCDGIYHELTSYPSPLVASLKDAFGEGIVKPDGSLDRGALAAIVFADGGDEARLLLNKITHEAVVRRVDELCQQAGARGERAVIIDAPLLFESGLDSRCDLTLGVTAPLEVRVDRLILRDGISRADALRRLGAQKSDEELSRLVDRVIRNDGSRDELIGVADALYRELYLQ